MTIKYIIFCLLLFYASTCNGQTKISFQKDEIDKIIYNKEGFQLIDDTEGYNSRPDIIAKKKQEKNKKIMNRVKVGDEIKHINQQTLLDNLDTYARKRGSDRVYVTNAEGKRGTIELRELKDALNAGYKLIDDTEGYNNRPDIVTKREQSQKATQTPTTPTNHVKRLKDSEIYKHLIKISTMNNLIIPIFLLIVIVLVIILSNKENPQKFLIINDNAWRWLKVIIALAALYIAYLFALNGRYTSSNDYIHDTQLEYRDKWNIQ